MSFALTISEIPLLWDGTAVTATLTLPPEPVGLALIAHGHCCARLSDRNRFLSSALAVRSLATLRLDLLTPAELAGNGRLRFDLDLLASRLVIATDRVRATPSIDRLPLAYLATGTAAAAAMLAAVCRADQVDAVVSVAGQPSLAGDALGAVRAATLLIVGGKDNQLLLRNREAVRRIAAPADVAVVANAGHLFEESGAIAQVAALAGRFLLHHLVPGIRTRVAPVTRWRMAALHANHRRARRLHAQPAANQEEAMRCQEIMSRPVESLTGEESVLTAARKMRASNIGLLPVRDASGKVIGTLTDRDIALRVCGDDLSAAKTRVDKVMTREIVACRTGDDLTRAERLMAEHHKSRILVLGDDDQLAGLNSLSDLARADVAGAAALLRQVALREVLDVHGTVPPT
jgi:putative phosphoribosyl transferase